VTGKLHAQLVTLVFVLRCHAGPEFFDFFVFRFEFFEVGLAMLLVMLASLFQLHSAHCTLLHTCDLPPLVIKLFVEALSVVKRET